MPILLKPIAWFKYQKIKRENGKEEFTSFEVSILAYIFVMMLSIVLTALL